MDIPIALGVMITFLSAIATLIFAVGALIVYELPEKQVWTTPVVDMLSPDGAWQALVDDVFYQPGWGGGQVIASVHLISTRDPTQVADILSVDTGGHGEERPRIAWTAADALRVVVPNLADLVVQRREYAGVHIDIRFDPDDPEARDAWFKWQDDWLHQPKAVRLMEQVSPDGDADAVVERAAADAHWFPAYNVYLIPKDRPLEREPILWVRSFHVTSDLPRIDWTDNHVLQVRVPNLSDLTVYGREYGSVHVDVRLDPDDPAARAAWLQKQFVPPMAPPERMR